MEGACRFLHRPADTSSDWSQAHGSELEIVIKNMFVRKQNEITDADTTLTTPLVDLNQLVELD